MPTDVIVATVGLILALSIASERLVEIIKGWIPSLDRTSDDPTKEGHRRSMLQILAVISGIVTAFLAKDYVPTSLREQTNGLGIIGLGLLASGGSGFWNTVLTYLTSLKDIASQDAKRAKGLQ